MSGRTRIKICGLTRREDAELAVDLGADAVGLIFAPASPRVVSPAQAREIVRALPPFVTRVGVFVNAPADEVEAIAEAVGLDVIQLHGDEDIAEYRGMERRLIKSVDIDDDAKIAAAKALPEDVLPLVDAVDPDRRGGTGRKADWDRAALLAGARRMILAGGLTSANVAEAVRRVRPWAVDVSSGVEERPGVKSAERLRDFFSAVGSAKAEDV